MARTANRTSPLASRTSRARLPKRNKPFFVDIVPGQLSLGWRSTSGAWIGRAYVGKGRYEIKGLAAKADDILDPDGEQILNFAQAQARLRQQYSAMVPAARRVTVGEAIDRYEADLAIRNGDSGNVARLRCHVSDNLLAKAVVDLETDELREWR
jgi:hypothetical protein